MDSLGVSVVSASFRSSRRDALIVVSSGASKSFASRKWYDREFEYTFVLLPSYEIYRQRMRFAAWHTSGMVGQGLYLICTEPKGIVYLVHTL